MSIWPTISKLSTQKWRINLKGPSWFLMDLTIWPTLATYSWPKFIQTTLFWSTKIAKIRRILCNIQINGLWTKIISFTKLCFCFTATKFAIVSTISSLDFWILKKAQLTLSTMLILKLHKYWILQIKGMPHTFIFPSPLSHHSRITEFMDQEKVQKLMVPILKFKQVLTLVFLLQEFVSSW